MAPLPSSTVTFTKGNLNRLPPNEDNIAAIIIGGVASLANKFTVKVYSLAQAEAAGITAQLDTTDEILAHFHISEFFRLNPNGELSIMTFQAKLDQDFFDTFKEDIKGFIRAENGRIKQLGIVLNAAAVLTTADIFGELEQLQERADELAEEKMWLDVIFVEGSNFTGTAADADDLRPSNLRNIAMVIGNDLAIATGVLSGTAAVGTVLGSSTRKSVHQSLAEANDDNTITSTSEGRFEGIKINSDLSGDLKNDLAALNILHDKGYIFPRRFPRRSGYFWNQSNNCVPSDDTYNSIELVQVIQKAGRIVDDILSKHINETFDVTNQGRLTTTARGLIEEEIRNAIEFQMADNISALSVIRVDPEFDDDQQPYPSLLADPTLRAFVGIRPQGKAEFIKLFLGYTQN